MSKVSPRTRLLGSLIVSPMDKSVRSSTRRIGTALSIRPARKVRLGYCWTQCPTTSAPFLAILASQRSLRPSNPMPNSRAGAWFSWGYVLGVKLARCDEAETAYREAIARSPNDIQSWHNLGNLLQKYLHRYTDSEVAYRKAIACDPTHPWPWNALGNLLREHLQRYIDAETAYQESIACDPKFASPMEWLRKPLLRFFEPALRR